MKALENIPYGYCYCGCGELTRIAKNDHSRHGWKKGEPIKFIVGHKSRGHNNPKWNGGKRIRADGYSYIWKPGHPRACRNYVMEHILVAEEVLGKPLSLPIEVHHVNGKRGVNEKPNLVICEDSSYHKLLHIRTRAFHECGHADWKKCGYCKKHDSLENLFVNSQGRAYHIKCEREYQRRTRKKNPVSRFIKELSPGPK